MELLAKPPVNVFNGDGGSYFAWSPTESTVLGESNVGAGKIVLHPLGFALPHYSDSFKLGLVLQGTAGVAGILLPGAVEERVVKLKEGHVIPVPLGAISWWFNDGNDGTDLVVVFLGVTSNGHIPGSITYYFLAGSLGLLAGFSTEVIRGAYGMDTNEANKLTKSQQNPLIIKLGDSTNIENLAKTEAIVGTPQLHQEEGKSTYDQAGLSVHWTRLGANAVLGPSLSVDSSIRLFYMVAGSGMVEIMGLNGMRLMKEEVKEGDLVVVPKFFACATIAGEHGMECAIVTTSPRPVLKDLAGKASPWKAMNPAAMEAALNVSPEFYGYFLSKLDQN